MRSSCAPTYDRRVEERWSLAVPLSIQPLNEHLQDEGESFDALSRDFSLGGIGFICTQPVSASLLRITIQADQEQAKLLVAIRRTIQRGAFFDIGGSFMIDWACAAG